MMAMGRIETARLLHVAYLVRISLINILPELCLLVFQRCLHRWVKR